MMLQTILVPALLACLASASPRAAREARQDSTIINVSLEHSLLDTIKEVAVPLGTDTPVAVTPAFAANIVDAECAGGCKIFFQCTLYGPDGIPVVTVGPGTTQFIYDAYQTVTAVSCGA